MGNKPPVLTAKQVIAILEKLGFGKYATGGRTNSSVIKTGVARLCPFMGDVTFHRFCYARLQKTLV